MGKMLEKVSPELQIFIVADILFQAFKAIFVSPSAAECYDFFLSLHSNHILDSMTSYLMYNTCIVVYKPSCRLHRSLDLDIFLHQRYSNSL